MYSNHRWEESLKYIGMFICSSAPFMTMLSGLTVFERR